MDDLASFSNHAKSLVVHVEHKKSIKRQRLGLP